MAQGALAEKLQARIAADGPIPVDVWMDACLADPEHGYYRTRDPLGRAGDFTTAPEISQMFGELIGLWAAVVWHQMGAPSAFRLVEPGPGRGTLMADALRAGAGVPGFADAAAVHLVETSPVLRRVQEKALAGRQVSWHASVDDVPPGPAIVIANEFLDALPVRQFVMSSGAWRERTVDYRDGRFCFAPGDQADVALPGSMGVAAEGAIFETSPAVTDVVAALAARLSRDGGAALLIDYGHDTPGFGDTLQAVRGHDFADPLDAPGACDVTAHVNFSAVADAARAAGVHAWGPVGQGMFLERLGIDERAARLLANATPEQGIDIVSARNRLVDGGAMGHLFKVLALTHPAAPPPPAFEG